MKPSAGCGNPAGRPAGSRRAGPNGICASSKRRAGDDPDRAEPGCAGLLHERPRAPCPSLGPPVLDLPLPRAGRHRPRSSIGGPGPRSRTGRCGRRLDFAPSVRPDLEPRPTPPDRSSGAPPNPTPRRHAFKLATVWLLAIGLLFAFGQPTAALIGGAILVLVCGLVTVTNFCIPSTLLGIWWRWRGTAPPATQPT